MRVLIAMAAVVWGACLLIDPSYWWAQGIGVAVSLVVVRFA